MAARLTRRTPSETSLHALGRERLDVFRPDARSSVPKAKLSVDLLRDDGSVATLAISSLRGLVELEAPLAHAFVERAESRGFGAFDNDQGAIRAFRAFLRDNDLEGIRLSDISDELLDRYRDWLDDHEKRPAPEERSAIAVFQLPDGGKLAVRTKRERMNVILDLLRALRLDPQHAHQLPDVDLVRGFDWATPGRRAARPKPTLNRPQLKKLTKICRREVVEATSRLRAFWATVDADEAIGIGGVAVGVALIAIAEAGVPPFRSKPELSRLSQSRPDLVDATQALGELDERELARACGLIFPTAREMMPFFILFLIYYRYNIETLAACSPDDFSRQPSVVGERMRGKPYKNRAGRTQYASWPVTNDDHNPAQMLGTIHRWTSSLRRHADPTEVGYMFLVASAGQPSAVKSYMREWIRGGAFRSFLDEHEEVLGTRFTLKSLRSTVLALVHHLFDGDVVVTAQAGQHASTRTTDGYLGDDGIRTREEALVPVLHLMDRLVETNGLIDGREDARMDAPERATPGWGCRDPYAQAMPGQVTGGLCRAYGMCPICPMAKLDLSSPRSHALVLLLRQAILDARSSMTERAWLARWAPVIDRIDVYHLPRFPGEVVAASERDFSDLPPLPTVE